MGPEKNKTHVLSVSQTSVVPASVSTLSGLPPGKELVKEADLRPGATARRMAHGEPTSCPSSASQTSAVPVSTSTLLSTSLEKRNVREADQRLGASEKNVKLDVNGSQIGAAPGGATAAPPRPAAAHALAGPGLSGARSSPRGPAGSHYSCCCQACRKVSTNPKFGCAGLGVLGSVDLFPRRFEGSVSEERLGSRTRTVTCVKLDVKRSWQDGGLWMVTAVRDRTRLGPRGGA